MKRFLAALIAVACVSVGACSESPDEVAAAARGEPTETYTMRAQVDMLPNKDKPSSQLILHHEPIPNFKTPSGKVGMAAMSMPFPVSKSVSLDDIAVGDIVQAELAVWSKPGMRSYEIRKLTKLPRETQLDFGK